MNVEANGLADRTRIMGELRSILQTARRDGLRIKHIFVSGVVLKMKDEDPGGHSSPVLAAHAGARPENILMCLVLNKEKTLPFFDDDGRPAVKPSRWGMPGGGVDEGKDLSGFDNLTPEELMEGVERALKREIREEVGIEIDPCWNLFSIERDERDDGIRIAITVVCEVVWDADMIDEAEIEMRDFFPLVRLPMNRVRNEKDDPSLRGMYTSHQRRLVGVLNQLGARFARSLQKGRVS